MAAAACCLAMFLLVPEPLPVGHRPDNRYGMNPSRRSPKADMTSAAPAHLLQQHIHCSPT